MARQASGHRRRFRAWIFTAVRSRHRFVYPVWVETTASAIEAMRFTAAVTREGDWHVAPRLETDVAGQGRSFEAALANLREALELKLEDGLSPTFELRGSGG